MCSANDCMFASSRGAKETSPASPQRACPWDGGKTGREGKWCGEGGGVRKKNEMENKHLWAGMKRTEV